MGILVVLGLTVVGNAELDGVELKFEEHDRHPEAHAGHQGEFIEYEFMVLRLLAVVVRRVVSEYGEGTSHGDIDENLGLDHHQIDAHRHLQSSLGRDGDAGEIDVVGLAVNGDDSVHDGVTGLKLLVDFVVIIIPGLSVIHHGEFQGIVLAVVLAVHLLGQLYGDSLVTGRADSAGAEALGLFSHSLHIERAAEIDVDGFFLGGVGKAGSRAADEEILCLRPVHLIVAHVFLFLIIGPAAFTADIRAYQVFGFGHDLDTAGLQTGGHLNSEAHGDTAVENGTGRQIYGVGKFQTCRKENHQLVEEEPVFNGVPLQHQGDAHSQAHLKAFRGDAVIPLAGEGAVQLLQIVIHGILVALGSAGVGIALFEEGIVCLLDRLDGILVGVTEGVGLRVAKAFILLISQVTLHTETEDVGTDRDRHFLTIGGNSHKVGDAKLQLGKVDTAAHVVLAHGTFGLGRIEICFLAFAGICQIAGAGGGGIGGGVRQSGGLHARQILHRLRA